MKQLKSGEFKLWEARKHFRIVPKALNYSKLTKNYRWIFAYKGQMYLVNEMYGDVLFFFENGFIYILSINKSYKYIFCERIDLEKKRIEDLAWIENDWKWYKDLTPEQILLNIISNY